MALFSDNAYYTGVETLETFLVELDVTAHMRRSFWQKYYRFSIINDRTANTSSWMGKWTGLMPPLCGCESMPQFMIGKILCLDTCSEYGLFVLDHIIHE